MLPRRLGSDLQRLLRSNSSGRRLEFWLSERGNAPNSSRVPIEAGVKGDSADLLSTAWQQAPLTNKRELKNPRLSQGRLYPGENDVHGAHVQ